ncbi:MAG: DUF805 domain-containing protein [Novosphingobium sp.]|uniref:DUF805 domain-containing protein n=1 Tax=Novosphingobium sp. TaxID=1874826 RepID=UPI0032BD6073
MEWMIMPFRRYADFSGRSRRMEYWMYQVFTLSVYLACFAIMMVGLPWNEPQGSQSAPGPIFWIGVALAVLWYVATFIPDIAVTVRRFHDQDQSGWLYLIRFIPSIGALVVMVFMFLDGQRQINQYGGDPKNPDFDTDVFS